MSADVREIATPDLVSETAVDGARVDVRLVGSAEGAALADLSTYLESVHRAALSIGASEVTFDIRSVEFMSAGCLRALLAWMVELQRSRGYAARFVSDAKRPWQRRTLEGLASFGGPLVRLD